MDKQQIYKLASGPKFISAIYNYCDQWCERCPLGSCCLNLAIEKDTATQDLDNQAFWTKVTQNFRVAIEMLEELARQDSIDFDQAIEVDEQSWQVKSHPLLLSANVYTKMVDEWVEGSQDTFKQKQEELNQALLMVLPGSNPHRESTLLDDAVEVIYRYKFLIPAKLTRAIDGLFHSSLANASGDADGSAKVVLIAIDRSIEMWGLLRNHLISQEDAILDILIYLAQLRRKIEQVFPNARQFIRPGFDEMPVK